MRSAGWDRAARRSTRPWWPNWWGAVGSTEIAAELGDRRFRWLIGRYLAVARSALRRHGGREIDTAGDGMFAIFDAPATALRAAFEARAAVLRARDPIRPASRRGRPGCRP